MRAARRFVLVAVLAWCLPAFSAEFRLPPDTHAREDGLWLKESVGAVRHQGATLSTHKVWRICLDAKADRALHELELREQAARVARLNQRCETPRPMVNGNTLTWTMQCAGPSTPGHKIDPLEVRHITSFLSGNETRSESSIMDGDKLIESEGRVLTDMKRLGECDDRLKAGQMMLMHSLVNGEETLKARQYRNIHEDIANAKAFTESRL